MSFWNSAQPSAKSLVPLRARPRAENVSNHAVGITERKPLTKAWLCARVCLFQVRHAAVSGW